MSRTGWLRHLVVSGWVAVAWVTPSPGAPAPAGRDWPMWRGNAARTAQSAQALPAVLHLCWTRQERTPSPAWPDTQHKLHFDVSYEPVAAGARLFVPSMSADRVTALDTATGRELWRFYADGPVRFAPVAWKTSLYVASDDGFLYCLDQATGQVKWKRRGGPDDRLILGNDRLISAWPVRGAPVLWEEVDGRATVYFAAGMWPFMGIFLHAVDAETGAIRWTNSGSGSAHIKQQHDSYAFAGVAPQGYLAATETHLLVAGGRTVPAVYDRKTGEFLYFNVADRTFGKDAGGYDVSVVPDFFFNNGGMYRLAKGEAILNLDDRRLFPEGVSARMLGGTPVLVTKTGLNVYGAVPDRKEEKVREPDGREWTRVSHALSKEKSVTAGWAVTQVHCQAGTTVYGSGEEGLIGAIDLAGKNPPWTAKVSGGVWTMFPADGRLFVVTTQGDLHCFGATPAAPATVHALPQRGAALTPGQIAPQGYALLWGLGDAQVARIPELVRTHHVIAADPDARRVADLRRKLDDAGLYGTRIHLLAGEPARLSFPPYLAGRLEFAALPAGGAAAEDAFARKVLHALRPYTGIAAGPEAAQAAFERAVARVAPTGTVQVATEGGARRVVVRTGPLPGSASWTHQYADVANTVVSQDDLVKPPLGLLWFGGPANDDILPRHGHGPAPQVVGGRLFIEGPDMLRAVDVYTGRLLWQREFKDLGKFYDNTSHQPGASEIGSNYVSLKDGVYVVYERACQRLDPATGQTVSTFRLPAAAGGGTGEPHWGYLGVYEDLLIAGSTPQAILPTGKDQPPRVVENAQYAASSREIVVMDRHTGKVLWTRRAVQLFRHNTICAGGGKIFCIDAISEASRKLLARRGQVPEQPGVVYALDARTGRVVWQSAEDVFGTWLGYSATHDVVLESGSPGPDRAQDEVRAGMTARRGRDGQRLWREATLSYMGVPMLHDKAIFTDGRAFEWTTGRPLTVPNPLTGQPMPWQSQRNYGCNTPIAGRHMMLFRSAAAGYYDLNVHGGTANWGGFKSGCTSNLIPADGVLNAPDYTRTCTCSYQNQSSLALVPMADVETWTFQAYDKLSGPLTRVGVNFGAPGDWPAPDGTLWLEQPVVGGRSPNLGVKVEGASLRYYRRHALDLQGPARPVTASGLEGAAKITVPLRHKNARTFTVRLYFAEPEAAAAGQRVFDVLMQGQPVLPAFDIFAAAGAARTGVVKEFKGIAIGETLTVELRAAGASKLPPVLGGIEAVAE